MSREDITANSQTQVSATELAHAAVHINIAERLQRIMSCLDDADPDTHLKVQQLRDSFTTHMSKAARIQAGETIHIGRALNPNAVVLSPEDCVQLEIEQANMVSRFMSHQLSQLKRYPAAPVPSVIQVIGQRRVAPIQLPPLSDGFDAQTVARIFSFWKHRSVGELDAEEHCDTCWAELSTTPLDMFDDGASDSMLSLVAWPTDDWPSAQAARLMPWHIVPWGKYDARLLRTIPIANRPAELLQADCMLLASLQHEFRSQLRQDPTSAWCMPQDVPATQA